MYVIRLRAGNDLLKFFAGIENQLLVITSISSKAMVFQSRADALIMSGFIENYFITLDPEISILPLTDDELIDFCCDLNECYFEV